MNGHFSHTAVAEARGIRDVASGWPSGQALRRKGFAEFDDVDLVQLQSRQRQHFLRRRRRADAHHARRHPGGGHADHARPEREAVCRGGGIVGQQQRAGAVVDAAGVARRRRAVGADYALEVRQRFQAGGARVFVGVDDERVALSLRHAHRRDLARQVAGLLRRHRTHLAGQCHAVLGLSNAAFES